MDLFCVVNFALFNVDLFLQMVKFQLFSINLFLRLPNIQKRCKKGVLRNFAKLTGKYLCQSLLFNKVAGLRPQACNFIKKETLAQVFSCEFFDISKKTFSYRAPLVAASGNSCKHLRLRSLQKQLKAKSY